MKPPPPRYRVVERGRRLEVIDTRTGRPVSQTPAPAPDARRRSLGRPPVAAERAGVQDGSSFTTRTWYDGKAPRRIRLNYATRQRFDQLRMTIAVVAALVIAFAFLFWPFFIPVLAVAGAVGWQQRDKARATVTRYLDGLDQAA